MIFRVGLCVGLLACSAPVSLFGQPEGTFRGERLAPSVVAIDSLFRSGEHERGFGIIVGSAGARRYIVTALHVVLREDDPDAGTPQVKVTFFGDQEHGRPAEISIHRDIDHDLVLLYVDGAADLPWVRDCLGASGPNPERMKVWFLGSGGKWVGPADPGVLVTSQPSPDKQQITATISGVARGNSGGPLLSDRGIIGMIQSASSGIAMALSVDFIRRKVQDEWKIPWELVPRTGLTIPIVVTNKASTTPQMAARGMAVVAPGTMTVGFDNGNLVFKGSDKPRADIVQCAGLQVVETHEGGGTRVVVWAAGEYRGGAEAAVGGSADFTYENRRVTGLKERIKALCTE